MELSHLVGHLFREPEVWERQSEQYIQYLMTMAVVEVLALEMCRGRRGPQAGSTNVSVKSQVVSITGFVGHIVRTTQLCYDSTEVAKGGM